MEDSFYFSLLRVSIAQILKTQGFDKCKPSTLNTITSLYIIYLSKLATESIDCSLIRTRTNSPEVQDVMQAMINLGLVKATQGHRIHDEFFDELEYNTKSINLFKSWVLSYYGEQIRDIAERKQRRNEQDVIDENARAQVDEKDDQQQQQQQHPHHHPEDFYHQFILSNGQTSSKKDESSKSGEEVDNVSSLMHDNNNNKLKWLNHLLEKDLKLGHKLKFLYATEFIANEFEQSLLKGQRKLKGTTNNTEQGVNESDLDLDLQLKIKSIRNSDWNDYIVKPVSATKAKDKRDDYTAGGTTDIDDIGAVDELVKKEAVLEKYLPYNIKYSAPLLSDDIDIQDDDKQDVDAEMEDSQLHLVQSNEI